MVTARNCDAAFNKMAIWVGIVLALHVPSIVTFFFLRVRSVAISLKAPPPQKSIFVQESPNELKFIGYVGGIIKRLW